MCRDIAQPCHGRYGPLASSPVSQCPERFPASAQRSRPLRSPSVPPLTGGDHGVDPAIRIERGNRCSSPFESCGEHSPWRSAPRCWPPWASSHSRPRPRPRWPPRPPPAAAARACPTSRCRRRTPPPTGPSSARATPRASWPTRRPTARPSPCRAAGKSVTFTTPVATNSIDFRYSIPDTFGRVGLHRAAVAVRQRHQADRLHPDQRLQLVLRRLPVHQHPGQRQPAPLLRRGAPAVHHDLSGRHHLQAAGRLGGHRVLVHHRLRRLRERRRRAVQPSGSVSVTSEGADATGDTVDDPNHYLVVSTWESLAHWQAWLGSSERQKIQAEIDGYMESPTQPRVFTY